MVEEKHTDLKVILHPGGELNQPIPLATISRENFISCVKIPEEKIRVTLRINDPQRGLINQSYEACIRPFNEHILDCLNWKSAFASGV